MWEANELGHLVTCPVEVEGASSPTLTIEDGAEVYFTTDSWLEVGSADTGRLVIDGDPAGSGVLLTAWSDDPAPGDWGGIYFGDNDQGSVISGAEIRYGGASWYALVEVHDATITISDSTISNSATSGLYTDEGEVAVEGTTIVDNAEDGIVCAADWRSSGGPGLALAGSFVDNTITGNGGAPIAIGTGTDRADFLGALGTGNTFTGNGDDHVYAAGYFMQDTTIPAVDVPIVAEGSQGLGVATSVAVTMEDGVTMHFASHAGLVVAGSLQVDGDWDTGQGVLFSGVDATPGSWSGIHVYDSGIATMSGFEVEYAGDGSFCSAGMCLENGAADLSDCLVSHNSNNGLNVSRYGASSTINVQDCAFNDNGGNGVLIHNGGWNATDVSLGAGLEMTGNGGYPLELEPDAVFDVSASWPMTGNGTDRVLIREGTTRHDGAWPAIPLSYEMTAGDWLTIDSAVTMDGITMLFGEEAIVWVDDSLTVDQSTFSATSSTWCGVRSGSPTVFTNSIIEGGGTCSDTSSAMLWTSGGMEVYDSTLQNSSSYAIMCHDVGDVTESGNTFAGNSSGDISGCY